MNQKYMDIIMSRAKRDKNEFSKLLERHTSDCLLPEIVIYWLTLLAMYRHRFHVYRFRESFFGPNNVGETEWRLIVLLELLEEYGRNNGIVELIPEFDISKWIDLLKRIARRIALLKTEDEAAVVVSEFFEAKEALNRRLETYLEKIDCEYDTTFSPLHTWHESENGINLDEKEKHFLAEVNRFWNNYSDEKANAVRAEIIADYNVCKYQETREEEIERRKELMRSQFFM